jgi:MFS family permease
MRRISPLAAVFFTVVIDLLGFGLVLPLLPLYGKEYGAADATTGAILASFSVMQFLFAPIWGRLSDRIGRRPVILAGLGGSVLSYSLFAIAPLLADPIPLLFASRAAAGLFGGTISTAYAYIADTTGPEERGRGMALIGAAFGIGFTVGPAVGGLGWSLSPSAPGWIAAGFSALALLFALRRLPEPARHVAPPRAAWWDRAAFREALSAPGVGTLFLLTFLGHGAFALFESTLGRLAQERFDFNPKTNGWLFSYLGLLAAFAQGFLVRRFIRRAGERRFAILGTLALGLGLLATGQAPSLALLLLVVPLPVLGFAMLNPSVASLLSRRTNPSIQGSVMGLNQSTASLARIAGPLAGLSLFGVGLTSQIGTALPYLAGTVVMALAFLLASRIRDTGPHPPPS